MDNYETDKKPESPASEETAGINTPQLSVGTILREARERLGMSVDDVVSRIKFAPRQIIAIEADDFEHLPEIAFVRGFVRSYARLLQMDPEPLLNALPHGPAQPARVAENTSAEVPFPTIYSTRRPNIIWLAAALVVALALGLFTFLHNNSPIVQNISSEPQLNVQKLELPSMEVLPASATAQTPEMTTVASAVGSTPVGKVSVELPVPLLTPVAGAQAEVRPAVTPGAAVIPAPVPATTKVTSAAPPASSEQKTVGMPKPVGLIRMTFDDESWVEVTDKDGKTLLTQINSRGSEQILDGKPPFSLVIGNAAGVRLYYKGKQIDLAPHTKVSTARLTLE